MSYALCLPKECLEHILYNFDNVKDLVRCSLVSKAWYAAVQSVMQNIYGPSNAYIPQNMGSKNIQWLATHTIRLDTPELCKEHADRFFSDILPFQKKTLFFCATQCPEKKVAISLSEGKALESCARALRDCELLIIYDGPVTVASEEPLIKNEIFEKVHYGMNADSCLQLNGQPVADILNGQAHREMYTIQPKINRKQCCRICAVVIVVMAILTLGPIIAWNVYSAVH